MLAEITLMSGYWSTSACYLCTFIVNGVLGWSGEQCRWSGTILAWLSVCNGRAFCHLPLEQKKIDISGFVKVESSAEFSVMEFRGNLVSQN